MTLRFYPSKSNETPTQDDDGIQISTIPTSFIKFETLTPQEKADIEKELKEVRRLYRDQLGQATVIMIEIHPQPPWSIDGQSTGYIVETDVSYLVNVMDSQTKDVMCSIRTTSDLTPAAMQQLHQQYKDSRVSTTTTTMWG